MTVHAAPVRYLPPPGASPAAGEQFRRRPNPGPGCIARMNVAVSTCNTLSPWLGVATLRLRTRVTLFFAFIALLAGIVLIGVTYGFARSNPARRAIRPRHSNRRSSTPTSCDQQLDDRTRRHRPAFFDNDCAPIPTASPCSSSIDRVVTRRPMTDLRHPLTDFPEQLVDSRRSATIGDPAPDDRRGEPYITVGVLHRRLRHGLLRGVPARRAPNRTLTALLTALTARRASAPWCSPVSSGWSTSRRLLRPLSQVADAAEEIASGGLDTRLAPESDPDLDRLAGSFNEMADAVQARIEREARFASDVSHELRSPITALTAAVEVLDARRDDIPERTQQALDVVVSQVRRFDSDGDRPARAGPHRRRRDRPERRGAVDLTDLTRPCRRSATADADVPIVVAAGRPREVALDKVRFERILGNLLDNADNHGGGATRIELIEPSPVAIGSAWPSRTAGPVSQRANASASSNASPAAAPPATGSAPASVSPSSPSTRRAWAARRGWRIDRAAVPGSSCELPTRVTERRASAMTLVRPRTITAAALVGARSALVGRGRLRCACR